jgi:hypothetical protein
VNPTNWSSGTPFTKKNTNCTQNPWPEKAEHRPFHGVCWQFFLCLQTREQCLSHCPAVEWLVYCKQGQKRQVTTSGSLLVSRPMQALHTWGDFHTIGPQPPSKLSQWEPALYYIGDFLGAGLGSQNRPAVRLLTAGLYYINPFASLVLYIRPGIYFPLSGSVEYIYLNFIYF